MMGKFDDDAGLEPICPWCGEVLNDCETYGYDIALEAHVDECDAYKSEQLR